MIKLQNKCKLESLDDIPSYLLFSILKEMEDTYELWRYDFIHNSGQLIQIYLIYLPGRNTIVWAVKLEEVVWQSCPVYDNMDYVIAESLQYLTRVPTVV